MATRSYFAAVVPVREYFDAVVSFWPRTIVQFTDSELYDQNIVVFGGRETHLSGLGRTMPIPRRLLRFPERG